MPPACRLALAVALLAAGCTEEPGAPSAAGRWELEVDAGDCAAGRPPLLLDFDLVVGDDGLVTLALHEGSMVTAAAAVDGELATVHYSTGVDRFELELVNTGEFLGWWLDLGPEDIENPVAEYVGTAHVLYSYTPVPDVPLGCGAELEVEAVVGVRDH